MDEVLRIAAKMKIVFCVLLLSFISLSACQKRAESEISPPTTAATEYECLMSGTNHLGETDSRPLDSCPECTAKILWMNPQDAVNRYQKLASFCERNMLIAEAKSFRNKALAVYSGSNR